MPPPLHTQRHLIANKLRALPLRTGDVFYRSSNAKGPFNIPFSRLVAWLSRSYLSHAAICLIENGYPYLVEINESGATKLRLVDWLDTCYTAEFVVQRHQKSSQMAAQFRKQIYAILHKDPDYDFTFNDPKAFYCTESVAQVYERIDIGTFEPRTVRQIVKGWKFWLLAAGSWIVSRFRNASIPLDVPLYYVGNESEGMLSSPKMKVIYHHAEPYVISGF
jgi:hypothetical protein